jgi:tetratricopeptide (TPR) repeat protein
MAGDFSEAARLYEQLTARISDKPQLWISYAHVLATIGRFDEAVAAYRRAIEVQPTQGEGWWCLANLKVARFGSEDIAAMLSTLGAPELDQSARVKLHFALGKAFEDAGNYSTSFEHYAAGNRIRALRLNYDPEETHRFVEQSENVFTGAFFRQLRGAGCNSPDPIFVVGLPRAGSTLIEQILATHSMIEGTAELRYLPAIRQRISAKADRPYPDLVVDLPHSDLRMLGERYLSSASVNRKTERPFFIDKLPNNWTNLGLILTILPNARIVDARRHPMACCFSNFKQYFARGQEFSYSLESAGRYYRDYVRLMDHFDQLYPGRIHRVIHERLIDDPGEEIAKLLDYVGVPFEEACLRFHENKRPVRTPSAEQVRQPLNRKGMEQWRNFEPWLGELEQALGPVLTAYPDVPEKLT